MRAGYGAASSTHVRLFDRTLVYPSDEVGPFVELEGLVVEVGEVEEGDPDVRAVVQTKEGLFTGYAYVTRRGAPRVGYKVQIRVYDSGGGWYPDNRIVRWRA